jgi:hypothetical protein
MNKYTEIITQNNELNKILIICLDLLRHFEQIFPYFILVSIGKYNEYNISFPLTMGTS